MQNLIEKTQWNTSPTAYLYVQYEYERIGTSMRYRFKWGVWLAYAESYYFDGLQLKFALENTVKYVTVKEYNKNEYGWNYSGTTEWILVPSKTSGNTKITISLLDTNTNAIKYSASAVLKVSTMMSKYELLKDNFDVDIGTAFTVTDYDASLSSKLDISCMGTVVKSLNGITSGAVVFTAAEKANIYALMSNVSSAVFTFVFTNYMSSGTVIGTSTLTATGYISNAPPTIDGTKVTIYDDDDVTLSVTKDEHCIVQDKSNIYVRIPSAIGNKGATITKYTIKIGEVSVTTDASGDVHIGSLAISGDAMLYITVEDSRGLTTTVSKSLSILEYAPPIITASLTRKNNHEVETHFEVNAMFSSINEKNYVSIAYEYAIVGEAYPSAESISNNTEYVLSCDNTKAYNFRITVTDAFGTTVTKEYVLSKGEFPLFIDIEKNAVGINSFPNSGEALRVGNGVAVFEDGIVIRSSTEESTKFFKISVDDSGQITASTF